MLKKQVFGTGYPSLPTVSVDQFITQKFKDGDLVFQKDKEIYSNSLQRYAEQPDLLREQEENSEEEHEEKEERDDQEEIARKRRWDEFKDENARGSGNRHNMG
jgi:immunoglobulin-binding protein 1